MKLTVQRPVLGQLESFLNYLKIQGTSPEHEANRDLIADFIDKVMVFELKRMTTEAKTYTEEIEVPTSLLLDPLRQVKKDFDKSFENLLGGMSGGSYVPTADPEEKLDSDWVEELVSEPQIEAASDPVSTTKRSGNGHKSTMVRKLTGSEKDGCRSFFLASNGQIKDDDCTRYKRDLMDPEVAIFQVTGFVSYLHREVAQGYLQVKDLAAYESWMQAKYGNLWAQYNNPTFISVRTSNLAAVAKGQVPTARVSAKYAPPKFAPPPVRA